MARVAFSCPAVTTAGHRTWLLWFLRCSSSQHPVPLSGASQSDHLTESSACSKRGVGAGLSFYSKDKILCVFHLLVVGAALLALLKTPQNNGNDCEERSLLMPRDESMSSRELFDHPELIPSCS